MTSIRMSPNQREVLSAISTITGKQEYLTSTNGALNTTGGGGGGGGTQYTDGATAPTHPIGTYPVFTNGSGTVIAVSTSNPLPITGTISVGSTTDSSTFTAGSSTTGPIAGVFNDSVAALTSGQQGTIRSTANRALHTNLRNVAGTEIATSSNPLRVDPTGTTPQPVTQSGTWNITNISGTISLPTGAATSALQTTGNTSLASIVTNQTNASQKSQIVDGSGNVIGSSLDVNGNRDMNVAPIGRSSDFWPYYNNMSIGGGQINIDPAGEIVASAYANTDGGTGRSNFTGSSVTRSLGTVTFTNGQTTVSGTGFTTMDVHYLDYVKLGSDSETAYAQVSYVTNDTTLTLFTPYSGTGGTGTGVVSQVGTITGTGATISVASGALTIVTGTNTSATTAVYRPATDGALLAQASVTVSQRQTNEDVYIGPETQITGTIQSFSRFHLTGTNNTQVITETGYNPTGAPTSAEMETNTVTIPGTQTTATARTYKIEQQYDQIIFSIDGIIVARHTKRIPHVMYEGQNAFFFDVRAVHSGAVTSTNIVIDYMYNRNFNRLEVIQSTPGDSTNSQVITQQSTTDSIAGAQSITVVDSGSTSTPQQSGQVAVTGTPTTGSAAIFAVGGYDTANVLVTGTWTGTLAIEVSFDGGNTYFTRGLRLDGTNTSSGSITLNASGGVNVAAVTNIRARATAAVTGTAMVRVVATVNDAIQYIANTGSFGAGTTAATAPTVAMEQGLIAATTLPTAVTAGQLVGAMGDKFGRPTVLVNATRDIITTQATTITSSTAETTIGTAVASTFLDLATVTVDNTSATAVRVDFRDTTAGTVRFSIEVPATDDRGRVLQVPIPQTSVNTNWTAQSSASVADLRIFTEFVNNK